MRRFEHAGKFWSIELFGSTFTVRWGAVGTAGQAVARTCNTDAAAAQKVAEQIARQQKLGYIEVAVAAPLAMPSEDRWHCRLINATEFIELERNGTTVVQRRGSLGPGEPTEQRFEHDSVHRAEDRVSRLLATANEQKFRLPGVGLMILDDEDDEPEVEEPEPPAPGNPKLEAACREAPEDPATWSVYADWLLEQGDPRGEVAAMFQREPASWKSKDLVRLHRVALFKHDEIGRVCEITRWCHGFPVAIAVKTREGSDLTQLEATKTILSRPFIQFVEEVRFGPQDFEGNNDWGPIILAVGNSPIAAHIKSLRFDDFEHYEAGVAFGDFSNAWSKLPALEELVIKSNDGGTLGAIALPALRRFVRITPQLDDGELVAIGKASWPLLEHLELWLGQNAGEEADISAIVPILANAMPALRHLGLVAAEAVAELVPALAASPLLRQLRTLDLSKGELDRALPLLDHAEAFAHLESLDLRSNFLEPRHCDAIRAALPNAKLDSQRSVAERYDDADE